MHEGRLNSATKLALPFRFSDLAKAGAVGFGMLLVTTTVLWRLKIDQSIEHPIFFFVLPTAAIAILYGFMGAALFACSALACSAFFLYDPIYSFYIADPRALGELICFGGLALIGAKCILELRRPSRP